MRHLFILLIVFLVLQPPRSIGQEKALTSYLPENTSLVVSFNPWLLTLKIGPAEIKESFIYRMLMKEGGSGLKNLLDDPTSSGIDLTKEIMVAMTENKDMPGYPGRVNLFGRLSNTGLFEAMMKKIFPDKPLLTYGTDRILMNEERGAIAWNDQVFTIISWDEESDDVEVYDESDSTEIFDPKKDQLRKEKNIKALRDHCFEMLTPKKQTDPGLKKHLASLLSSPGDIKIWHKGAGNKLTQGFPLHGILKILETNSSGIKTAVINFEKGKILVQNRDYLDEDLATAYQNNPVTPFDQDLARRMPAGKLLGMLNVSYNSRLINELFRKQGFNEIKDSLQSKLNFDLQKLPDVFKNNLMISVTQSDTCNCVEGIQLVMAMRIADKEKFLELRSAVMHVYDSVKKKEKENLEDSSGHYEQYLFPEKFNPYVRHNDEFVVLSLSAETAAAFLNGPGEQPVAEWITAYQQYPVLMQMNIRDIIKTVYLKNAAATGRPKDCPDTDTEQMMNVVDRLLVYGGNYENGIVNTNSELIFTDSTVNSLKQLFGLINKFGDMMTRNEDVENRDDMSTDTLEVTIEEIKQEGVKQPPPPPPPPHTKPPKVEMKQFTPPIVKKDEEVKKSSPPVKKKD